jgi:hypothetical protein
MEIGYYPEQGDPMLVCIDAMDSMTISIFKLDFPMDSES